jgi:hypothetical protein
MSSGGSLFDEYRKRQLKALNISRIVGGVRFGGFQLETMPVNFRH